MQIQSWLRGLGVVFGGLGFIEFDTSKYKTEFITLITLYGLSIGLLIIDHVTNIIGTDKNYGSEILTGCVLVIGLLSLSLGIFKYRKKSDDTKEKYNNKL